MSECVKYYDIPNGNGWVSISESHGSIDHTYKASLDDIYIGGSGDTYLECLKSVMESLRRTTAAFEQLLEQEENP